jgi:Fe-S cluster biogenesis protein NfuA
MGSQYDEILRVLRQVVAPLVEADGGEVFLVSGDSSHISIHLAGRLAGAPGNNLLSRRILEPALRAVMPTIDLSLSSGCLIPAGAVRLTNEVADSLSSQVPTVPFSQPP